MTTPRGAPLTPPERHEIALLFACDPACGYEEWQRIIAAAQHAGIPEHFIDQWSSGSSKFVAGRDEVARRGFNRADGDVIATGGTLAHYAAQHGGIAPTRVHGRSADLKPAPLTVPDDELTRYAKVIPIEAFDLPPVHWAIPGLLVTGGGTLLHGPPKSGKSTLLAHLLTRNVWPGGEIPEIKWWYYTEETPVALHYRYARFGINLAHVESLRKVTFWERAPIDDWNTAGLAEEIYANYHRATTPPGVIAIDTMLYWLDITDSNAAGEVIRSLRPLLATSTRALPNVATLIIHHTRKGADNTVNSILGSAQIGAAFDNIAGLTRNSDFSQLRLTSRFLPEEETLEFREELIMPDGPTLVQGRGGVRHDAILDTLIGGGEMTITDIAEASGVLYKTTAQKTYADGKSR